MPCKPFKFGQWNGLVDDDFARHLPEVDAILQKGQLVVNKPDRIVRRIVVEGATYYAKSFLPPKRLVEAVKRSIRRPIPFRLWQTHNDMLDKGIQCAKPMLAALESSGVQLFICSEIAFPTSRTLIKESPAEKLPEVFAQAAKAIAALHRAGFVHGDSLPGNICLGPDRTFAFIDNDRTSHIPSFFSRAAKQRNLIQFCAHTIFREGIGNELFTLFLVEYMKEYVNVTPSTETVGAFIKTVVNRIAEIKKQQGRKV